MAEILVKEKSNHLFDPFTSIPAIGTNSKKIKQTINKKNDNLSKFFFLEKKKNYKKKPKPMKNKCLKKIIAVSVKLIRND